MVFGFDIDIGFGIKMLSNDDSSKRGGDGSKYREKDKNLAQKRKNICMFDLYICIHLFLTSQSDSMASHPPSTICPLSIGYSRIKDPRCSSSFFPTNVDVGPDDKLCSVSNAPPGMIRVCLVLPTLVPITTCCFVLFRFEMK